MSKIVHLAISMEPRGPRACGLLSLLLLSSHLAYNRSLIALTISVDQVTHFLPWVPEDIFFLSMLMVRGEAASTRRREKKKPQVTGATSLIFKQF